MILAVDTYYFENKAKTIGICFEDWASVEPLKIYSEILEGIEDYVPGKFYKRELPCILSLLQQIDITDIEAIIIDGYVYIDDDMNFGLGGYLYAALLQKTPVIGVAKSNFKGLDKFKLPLYRGNSINPLYITSIGMESEVALNYIKAMHGVYRLPALLKALDVLTKTT